MTPGKIEFPLPDRRQKRLIFQTITSKMNLSEELIGGMQLTLGGYEWNGRSPVNILSAVNALRWGISSNLLFVVVGET